MWLTNIVTKLSSYEVNMIYIQNPYWELLVGGGFKYVFIFTPIWVSDSQFDQDFSKWVGSTTN